MQCRKTPSGPILTALVLSALNLPGLKAQGEPLSTELTSRSAGLASLLQEIPDFAARIDAGVTRLEAQLKDPRSALFQALKKYESMVAPHISARQRASAILTSLGLEETAARLYEIVRQPVAEGAFEFGAALKPSRQTLDPQDLNLKRINDSFLAICDAVGGIQRIAEATANTSGAKEAASELLQLKIARYDFNGRPGIFLNEIVPFLEAAEKLEQSLAGSNNEKKALNRAIVRLSDSVRKNLATTLFTKTQQNNDAVLKDTNLHAQWTQLVNQVSAILSGTKLDERCPLFKANLGNTARPVAELDAHCREFLLMNSDGRVTPNSWLARLLNTDPPRVSPDTLAPTLSAIFGFYVASVAPALNRETTLYSCDTTAKLVQHLTALIQGPERIVLAGIDSDSQNRAIQYSEQQYIAAVSQVLWATPAGRFVLDPYGWDAAQLKEMAARRRTQQELADAGLSDKLGRYLSAELEITVNQRACNAFGVELARLAEAIAENAELRAQSEHGLENHSETSLRSWVNSDSPVAAALQAVVTELDIVEATATIYNNRIGEVLYRLHHQTPAIVSLAMQRKGLEEKLRTLVTHDPVIAGQIESLQAQEAKLFEEGRREFEAERARLFVDPPELDMYLRLTAPGTLARLASIQMQIADRIGLSPKYFTAVTFNDQALAAEEIAKIHPLGQTRFSPDILAAISAILPVISKASRR